MNLLKLNPFLKVYFSNQSNRVEKQHTEIRQTAGELTKERSKGLWPKETLWKFKKSSSETKRSLRMSLMRLAFCCNTAHLNFPTGPPSSACPEKERTRPLGNRVKRLPLDYFHVAYSWGILMFSYFSLINHHLYFYLPCFASWEFWTFGEHLYMFFSFPSHPFW